VYDRTSQNITVFICNNPVVRVDKGDIYTLISGFVVILLIAVIANPGAFSKVQSQPFSGSNQTVQATGVPASPVTFVTPSLPTPTQIPEVNQTPRPPAAPYRITYTSNPFTYPVIHLPEHMETFGASDFPPVGQSVPFAYVEESRGGLTKVFSVPYKVWALNISVTADRQPQYAMFRMVLCDAKTGNIIEGAEIQNPGTMYKVVRTSSTGLYMIISTDYVDSFRITLETPQQFYEKDRLRT